VAKGFKGKELEEFVGNCIKARPSGGGKGMPPNRPTWLTADAPTALAPCFAEGSCFRRKRPRPASCAGSDW